jgi:Zn finger protein HypA/HybF involved in hydrogenase expression
MATLSHMAEINLNERTSVICPRCNATISWPSLLTDEMKSQIAMEVRSEGLPAIRGTMSKLGLGLSESKALLFHITRVRGQCHRCKQALTTEALVCERCKSANLDW